MPWPITVCNGCYDDSWRGIIVDAAFAHPAKAARGLLVRIFDYLFDRGYLAKGETVVDCFGGIGTTGIEAASRGCRSFAVELEPKFIALAGQNIDLHRRIWEQSGDPLPIIVQGDSRRLREALGSVMADVVMSSPPYAECIESKNGPSGLHVGKKSMGRTMIAMNEAGYGSSPGQLGSMPAGSVDAVVSSPPYAECLRGDNSAKETAAESQAKRLTPGGSLGQSCRHAGYGSAENLGNLPAGNVDCVVSSPPFEAQQTGGGLALVRKGGGYKCTTQAPVANCGYQDQGTTDGQLGNSTGETFWTAARDIVAEAYAILKPGGIACWIVKAFVRNKAIVDFPGDWRKLCEAAGFETVEEVHASLVKADAAPSLFGGTDVKRTERKSFFRRLAERKGSPRIDFEVVWVMRKRDS